MVFDSATGEEKEIKTVSRAEVTTVFAYILGVLALALPA